MILLPFSIPYPLLTSKRVLYEYVDSLLALRTPREPVCSPVPLHRGYCTQYITVRTLREKPTYRYVPGFRRRASDIKRCMAGVSLALVNNIMVSVDDVASV